MDVYKDQNSFVIRAELPGFLKEDLSLEVVEGTLKLTGHLKQKEAEKDRQEDRTTHDRQVSRSIPLPEQVKIEGIQGSYENGVLTVTLPKQEEAKPRRVTIDVK